MADIRIIPASSIMSFTSSLNFTERITQDASGSLNLYGSGSTGRTEIFSVDGGNGRLFTVSDDLSDSLFSVNTIAGLPVIEAFADNTVKMGQYGQNDFIISENKIGIGLPTPAVKLDVSGTIRLTGDNNPGGNMLMLNSTSTGLGDYILTCNDSNSNSLFYVYGNATNTNVSIGIGDALENLGQPYLIIDHNSAKFGNTNVGIGTSSPAALLDVNGDALINGLTVGRGGGNISTNTALGVESLASNSSGAYNISIGYRTNRLKDRTGNVIIGSNLNYMPTGVDEIDSHDNLIIGQYNSNFSTQVPHIYSPAAIYCPNNSNTTILQIDYTLYTAAFLEYSLYDPLGGKFRAGRFVTAYKSTGTTEENDIIEVHYSSSTTGVNLRTGGSGTIVILEVNNTTNDDFYIRYTSRLLMR